MNPYLIHIETSTDICSVALSKGNELIGLAEEVNSKHINIITLLIEKLVKEANISYKDISAVSVSEGPGSYTSLRIGVSVAKSISYTLEIPMIAIPSLMPLAFAQKSNITASQHIMPMIDARRMEVYTAIYDIDLNIVMPLQAFIITLESIQVISQESNILICGNGAFKMKDFENPKINIIESVASAANQIEIALDRYHRQIFDVITRFEPNYLKLPNITTPKKSIL